MPGPLATSTEQKGRAEGLGLGALARAREGAYRLLGALLRAPEPGRLAAARAAAAAQRRRPGVLRELALFPEWRAFLLRIEQLAEGSAPELGERYTRLFVAGPEGICPPFASHYLAPEAPALVLAACEREYAAAGLALVAPGAEPPDHVAVVLDFLAQLCALEAAAWRGRDRVQGSGLLEREARFLERFVCSWLPAWAEAVAGRESEGFYARAAQAAACFAAHDRVLVAACGRRLRQERAP